MTRGVVIVTGVAGGIGGATADLLAESGWSVHGVDRRPVPTSTRWPSSLVDLADEGRVAEVAQSARTAGPVAGIVHCAAEQPIGRAGSVGRAEWLRTLAVNVVAADELVGACIDDLRATRGAVVAISSVHAIATTPQMVAYATSKSALTGWARAAALDLGPLGIRVNTVLPGAVDTPMLRAGLLRRPSDGDEAEALATLAARTPLRTVAHPRQIATVVRMLLDPGTSAFVTGAEIVADGGATIHLSTEQSGD